MTRPEPRIYRSQVSVEPVGRHLFMVRAVPYPVHTARVAAYMREGKVHSWSVRMLTTGAPKHVSGLPMLEALALAGEWVGLETGRALKERFAGVQRTAMGQGKCPHLGKVLCLRSASPGSVWCELHPDGRKVVNDVSASTM